MKCAALTAWCTTSLPSPPAPSSGSNLPLRQARASRGAHRTGGRGPRSPSPLGRKPQLCQPKSRNSRRPNFGVRFCVTGNPETINYHCARGLMRFCMRTAAAIGGFLLAALPAGANPNILDLAGQCHWQSKQKACNKLADLAEHDRDAAVRILAVKQLDDQAVLARVAQADTDEAVRSAAVSTLSAIAFGRDLTVEDQGLLAQIAETDGGGSYQALARLKDQAL